MPKQKIFLFIIAAYFSLGGIFHFIRLGLGWKISVGNFTVPTLFSAFSIIFAIFMVYWVLKIKREKNKVIEVREETQEE